MNEWKWGYHLMWQQRGGVVAFRLERFGIFSVNLHLRLHPMNWHYCVNNGTLPQKAMELSSNRNCCMNHPKFLDSPPPSDFPYRNTVRHLLLPLHSTRQQRFVWRRTPFLLLLRHHMKGRQRRCYPKPAAAHQGMNHNHRLSHHDNKNPSENLKHGSDPCRRPHPAIAAIIDAMNPTLGTAGLPAGKDEIRHLPPRFLHLQVTPYPHLDARGHRYHPRCVVDHRPSPYTHDEVDPLHAALPFPLIISDHAARGSRAATIRGAGDEARCGDPRLLSPLPPCHHHVEEENGFLMMDTVVIDPVEKDTPEEAAATLQMVEAKDSKVVVGPHLVVEEGRHGFEDIVSGRDHATDMDGMGHLERPVCPDRSLHSRHLAT